MQFLEKNFVALILFESSNNPENPLKFTVVARYITQSVKWPEAKFRNMIASLPPAKANAFKSACDIILEESIEIGIEKGRREMLAPQVRNMLKCYPEPFEETTAELLGINAPFVASLRAEA